VKYTISETCQELIARLASFLDGELDPALCEKVEQHLATCPYCRIVVDTTKKTVALYHDAPRETLPADVRQHLIAVLGLEKESRRLHRFKPRT